MPRFLRHATTLTHTLKKVTVALSGLVSDGLFHDGSSFMRAPRLQAASVEGGSLSNFNRSDSLRSEARSGRCVTDRVWDVADIVVIIGTHRSGIDKRGP